MSLWTYTLLTKRQPLKWDNIKWMLFIFNWKLQKYFAKLWNLYVCERFSCYFRKLNFKETRIVWWYDKLIRYLYKFRIISTLFPFSLIFSWKNCSGNENQTEKLIININICMVFVDGSEPSSIKRIKSVLWFGSSSIRFSDQCACYIWSKWICGCGTKPIVTDAL